MGSLSLFCLGYLTRLMDEEENPAFSWTASELEKKITENRKLEAENLGLKRDFDDYSFKISTKDKTIHEQEKKYDDARRKEMLCKAELQYTSDENSALRQKKRSNLQQRPGQKCLYGRDQLEMVIRDKASLRWNIKKHY